MPRTFVWTITVPGVSKAQSVALAMEFWTSLGFAHHSTSYNMLVFRRNDFGSTTTWLKNFWTDKVPWSEVPLELDVAVQIRPNEARYTLTFRTSSALSEMPEADWRTFTEPMIGEFIEFCNQWIANARLGIE